VNKTVALVAAVIFVFIPYPSHDSPEWHVQVVDGYQRRMAGVTVRESYQNFSSDAQVHEVDLITDYDGRVVFPAKPVWRSLMVRFFMFAGSMSRGLDARYGVHASVKAFSNGLEGAATRDGKVRDWTGKPPILRSVIVLHPAGR
jgi:hypothetical protein